jgi:hypothetical protein
LLRDEKTSHILGKKFPNHLSDKGPISKTHKELLKLNNKKINNLIKNGQDTIKDIDKYPVVHPHSGNLCHNKKKWAIKL